MSKRNVALIASLIAAAVATPVAATAQERAVGRETTIAFASNGSLRNWQAGPSGSNIVFVQDRRGLWYQLKLSGPCLTSPSDGFGYETNNAGGVDLNTPIWSLRNPNARCGIESIKTSNAP